MLKEVVAPQDSEAPTGTFRFPSIPVGWHYIGPSSKFKNKPVKIMLRDRKIVVFRSSDGKLSALYGQCPHMGADLSYGKICNDRLVCPFHGWEFGTSGKCEKILNTTEIPPHAKVQTYPVTERHGLVYLFYGSKALYDLPFFDGLDPDDFFCDSVQHIYQEGEWFIVPSNAFDPTHFIVVHKRIPLSDPVVTDISPYSKNIHYRYRVADTTLADRLIRFFYGEIAELSFTTWSGNLIFATTNFNGFKNYMMIFLEPLVDGYSVSNLFIFSPGAKKGPIYRGLKKIPMRLQSHFSRIFFQREADMLKNVRFNAKMFLPADQVLKDYLVWLSKL